MRLLTCAGVCRFLFLCGCGSELASEPLPLISYVRSTVTAASTAIVTDTVQPYYESMNGEWLGNDCVINLPLGARAADGTSITELKLTGSALSGKQAGIAIQGNAFKGVTLPAMAGSKSGKIRIIDTNLAGDVTSYVIKFLPSSSSDLPANWVEPCWYEVYGIPSTAIPIAGTWDAKGTWQPPGTGSVQNITFACTKSAIGKCVTLGYLPWVNRNTHQACTRMLRADYCGDGSSYTQSGTEINIQDKSNIHNYTSVPDWTECCIKKGWFHEAAWTEKGAKCVSHFRFDTYNMKPPTCIIPQSGCEDAARSDSEVLIDNLSVQKIGQVPHCVAPLSCGLIH